MSKQRQKPVVDDQEKPVVDDRDIFDKALDWAPLIGAVVAGRAMRRASLGQKPFGFSGRPKDVSRADWKAWKHEDRWFRRGATTLGAASGLTIGRIGAEAIRKIRRGEDVLVPEGYERKRARK